MTKDEYEVRLEELMKSVTTLEAEVRTLKETCCSTASIESNLRVRYDIGRLIDEFKMHNRRLDDLDKSYKAHQRLLHIGIGVLIAFQLFGMDDRLIKVLLG